MDHKSIKAINPYVQDMRAKEKIVSITWKRTSPFSSMSRGVDRRGSPLCLPNEGSFLLFS